VRGRLRPRDHRARRQHARRKRAPQRHRHPHSRRHERRVLEGLHLPEGLDAEAVARRPRSSAPAAREAGRQARRSVVGRSVGGRRPWPLASDQHARTRIDRRVSRQPRRAQLGSDDLQPCAAHCDWQPATFQRIERRPSTQASVGGFHVRHGGVGARARPRPHRLSAHARRQPVCEQRQSRDRARLAGSSRSDSCTWRQDHRRRPASQSHRRVGRRMARDSPGHRRIVARCDGHGGVRSWSRRAGGAPHRSSQRHRRCARRACGVHARACRASSWYRRRHDQENRTRVVRRTACRRVRTHRDHDGRLRHHRIVVGGRAQCGDRQPRHRGRCDVPVACRGRPHDPWQEGRRQGLQNRSREDPRARLPRGTRGVPRRADGRRDSDAGPRADSRDGGGRRQPPALDAQQRSTCSGV